MGKKYKTNRNNNTMIAPPQTIKRTAPIWVGISLAVVAVGVCLGVWWWVSAKPDFEKIKGKWFRTDGGYVLEVKQIAPDGKIDAAYLNPRPINVSKAAASSDAGKINVFVELRDRLYPGNYYKLTYDAGKDQLSGMYYHLGIQQQLDVIFVRMK